jgi:hypothetical protein
VSLPQGDSKRGLVDLILTSPGSLTDTPYDKAQRMGKQDEMRKQEKQPWNPLPLRSLDVEGLGACAKTLLIYLAARSNIKGETCVGHRRMCKDLVRSKDFVTNGLAELEGKGYLSTSQRGRKAKEADWRVLNADLILKNRTTSSGSSPDPDISSPEEQDYIPNCSPAFGDCSPARQGETSSYNLADSNQPHNLADENNNNQPVVVVSEAPDEMETPSLVAGYTPEQIASHAEACKLNPWVHANDSPNARKREPFVRHLMTIDPPRKALRMAGGKPLPAYRQDSGERTVLTGDL